MYELILWLWYNMNKIKLCLILFTNIFSAGKCMRKNYAYGIIETNKA